MASLFVLTASAAVLRILGRLGVEELRSWRTVGRTSSSVMLLFTGASHFSPMKEDLVEMLPEPLPKDVRIIHLTGLAEIAGAIGLLIPRTRRAAGLALVLQLAAMFPANVSASRRGVALGGRPPTPLWIRGPMQALYVVVIWSTAVED